MGNRRRRRHKRMGKQKREIENQIEEGRASDRLYPSLFDQQGLTVGNNVLQRCECGQNSCDLFCLSICTCNCFKQPRPQSFTRDGSFKRKATFTPSSQFNNLNIVSEGFRL